MSGTIDPKNIYQNCEKKPVLFFVKNPLRSERDLVHQRHPYLSMDQNSHFTQAIFLRERFTNVYKVRSIYVFVKSDQSQPS